MNGYYIEKVEIEAADGSDTYMINNPLVFVVPSATRGGVDASVGSNFFETTQVLFDGSNGRLGLFRGECEEPSIPGDIDGDGVVDRFDLNLMLADRGTPATGPDDPKDLDDDGLITVLDARICVTLCDLPRCVTAPPP